MNLDDKQWAKSVIRHAEMLVTVIESNQRDTADAVTLELAKSLAVMTKAIRTRVAGWN